MKKTGAANRQNRDEVEAYLAKLRYALADKNTSIQFIEQRCVDVNRSKKYSNAFTVAKLFPDKPAEKILRDELASLRAEEYIETVADTTFAKRSALWVFGKRYGNEEVYIKFRVEIIQRSHILVISFHFSTVPFSRVDFPFAK